MEKKIYELEKKEDKPVIAICYDFDKTLSPDDMQAQGYIQSVNYDVKEFWEESNELAQENDMDQNLAYMLKMVEKSRGKFYLTRESLMEYGANVQLFNGVETWFKRICEYAKEKNVIVEHYIISSGLKEMIEGTKMAKENMFKRIYASSFYYDKDNVVKWPSQVVNYTNKTQFLFRIEKGVLDINDDRVNNYFPPEKMRIPFRNIVYIGDSATDIPCMKLVNSYGGYSVGVYNPESNDKSKVYNMINENRIKYFVPADYSEDSEMDILIKKIIDKTQKNEEIENTYYINKKEADEHMASQREGEKNNMIFNLRYSRNYAATHTIIQQLNAVDNWNESQLEQIFYAAVVNGQISSIINDPDIKLFYKGLMNKYSFYNDDVKKVVGMLEKKN